VSGPNQTRAVTLRYYARSPMAEMSSAGVTRQDHQLAHYAADATAAAGTIICDVLQQALLVVDDFGFTTGAARLTNRDYWRNLTPTRGSPPCSCGRGSWGECQHRWGKPAPSITVPDLAGTQAV
jgi:hypothetical protein